MMRKKGEEFTRNANRIHSLFSSFTKAIIANTNPANKKYSMSSTTRKSGVRKRDESSISKNRFNRRIKSTPTTGARIERTLNFH
jgi:hypothetical protein